MLSPYELSELCSDDESELDDLRCADNALEESACAFCGKTFGYDADLWRHFERYGCGCVEEYLIDFIESAFETRIANVESIECSRRDHDSFSVRINGKARSRVWTPAPFSSARHRMATVEHFTYSRASAKVTA